MTRARNRDGTFKSAFDVMLEREEAIFHADVKAKMDEGMTFDEAWVAAGGSIMTHDDISREVNFVNICRRIASLDGGDR